MHQLNFSGVCFAWPGEKNILENINLHFLHGLCALTGPNGHGKTTLLRLATGEIAPLSGSVTASAQTLYLAAKHEITAGETLSSGELRMRRLESELARFDGILLLDEPETHLDAHNRRRLIRLLARRRGITLLVSHEGELLESCTAIVHIENRTAQLYRMNYAAYAAAIDARRKARLELLRQQDRELTRTLRQAETDLERQERRNRTAAKNAPYAGIPRIARGLMERNAEKTTGKLMARSRERIEKNRIALTELRRQNGQQGDFSFSHREQNEQKSRIEADKFMLFDTHNRALWQQPLSFSAGAGEKIHVTGLNGAGKSMLFAAIAGASPLQHSGGLRCRSGSLRLFDSQLSQLDAGKSLLGFAQEFAPGTTEGRLRALLGAFGYRGETVFRSCSSLSTGQKVRLLIFFMTELSDAPDCLISDEAETGLDRNTRMLYADFLRHYAGLLLFASHSRDFAAAVQPTAVMQLR